MKDEQLKPDHHEDAKKIIKFTGSVKPGEGGMTRKEQIRKMFQKVIYKDGDIYVFYSKKALDRLINEISTLPLDVPNDAGIDKKWIFEIIDKTTEFQKQLINDHFERHNIRK